MASTHFATVREIYLMTTALRMEKMMLILLLMRLCLQNHG